jgi:hypothetical protein
MTHLGHEERSPPTRLSAACGFRKETFAGASGNDEDAPIPAVRRIAIEQRGIDAKQTVINELAGKPA